MEEIKIYVHNGVRYVFTQDMIHFIVGLYEEITEQDGSDDNTLTNNVLDEIHEHVLLTDPRMTQNMIRLIIMAEKGIEELE